MIQTNERRPWPILPTGTIALLSGAALLFGTGKLPGSLPAEKATCSNNDSYFEYRSCSASRTWCGFTTFIPSSPPTKYRTRTMEDGAEGYSLSEYLPHQNTSASSGYHAIAGTVTFAASGTTTNWISDCYVGGNQIGTISIWNPQNIVTNVAADTAAGMDNWNQSATPGVTVYVDFAPTSPGSQVISCTEDCVWSTNSTSPFLHGNSLASAPQSTTATVLVYTNKSTWTTATRTYTLTEEYKRQDVENRILQDLALCPTNTWSPRPITASSTLSGTTVSLTKVGYRIRLPNNASSGSYVVTEDLKLVYDGWLCIAELNATNNTLVRSYVWGLDLSGSLDGAGGVGGLLLLNSAANGAHFYAYDGNGNVTGLVATSDGSESARYEYEPFGELLRATGPLAFENAYGFSTKRRDATTGALLYEFRIYLPWRGTWASRDPLEESGGVNLYGMINNDPVNSHDPLGLMGPCDKFENRIKRLATEIPAKQAQITANKNVLKQKLYELKIDEDRLKIRPDGPGVPNWQSRRAHWERVNVLKKVLARQKGELVNLEQQLALAKCELEACERAQNKLLQKAEKGLLKKCATFICRKTPLAAVLFACDAAEGGACHAVNEFVWPVSELWNDGPPLPPPPVHFYRGPNGEIYAGPNPPEGYVLVN